MTRRPFLFTSLTVLAIGAFVARTAGADDGDTRRTLTLRETAGLRRFGYPVHARLPGGLMGPNFRLVRDGKAVPAQFRRVDAGGEGAYTALDFNVSVGPLETLEFQVEGGPGVTAGPEPRGGMAVDVKGGVFRVSSGSVLAYVVPETLDGVFQSVNNVRLEFWDPQGRGLYVKPLGGELVKLGGSGGVRGRVTRSGPFAVGLRFEGELPIDGGPPLASVVEMTFPNSKSWAEVRWTVGDPGGKVGGLVADLGLKVEVEPTVVDLGANNTVYGFLRGKERMTLEAGAGLADRWLIRKGAPGALTAFARSAGGEAPPAEGWAHVIDALRCTALGVDRFGLDSDSRDAIEVDATGAVLVARTYPAGGRPGPKSLTFWLHFVNNPVQIGAVTSPQAMLAPLRADWSPGTD